MSNSPRGQSPAMSMGGAPSRHLSGQCGLWPPNRESSRRYRPRRPSSAAMGRLPAGGRQCALEGLGAPLLMARKRRGRKREAIGSQLMSAGTDVVIVLAGAGSVIQFSRTGSGIRDPTTNWPEFDVKRSFQITPVDVAARGERPIAQATPTGLPAIHASGIPALRRPSISRSQRSRLRGSVCGPVT